MSNPAPAPAQPQLQVQVKKSLEDELDDLKKEETDLKNELKTDGSYQGEHAEAN